MNKIYRTLWNKVTQSWVVTSELAKSGGKGSSGKSALVNTANSFNLTFIATSILLAAETVSATEISGGKYPITTLPNKGNYCFFDIDSNSVICGDTTTKTEDKYTTKPAKSVILGSGASNKGESNVAIGPSAKTENATGAIAIGSSAVAKAEQAIAIGQNAEGNSKWDISIGRSAGRSSTNKNGEGRNIAIGDGALKNGKEINNNIALGTSAGDSFEGTHSLIIGTYANTNSAVDSALNAGTKASELGSIVKSTANNKDVYHVKASNVIALGHRALTTNTAAIAIGQQAKAFGVTTVAVGNGSRSLKDHAVAMGREANAGEGSAIAIGLRANYDANKNGVEAYKKTGASSIALGAYTHSASTHSIAIGTNATVKGIDPAENISEDKKQNKIIKATLGTELTGNGSVSIGSSSLVRGTNAVAIGQAAETLGQNAFAGGNDSHANGKSAVAIGDGATALKDSSTAIGSYTRAFEGGAGAFGYNARALAFHSLALGADSEATAISASSIAIGDKAKVNAEKGIAIGADAQAVGEETSKIAIGDKAYADASGAIVIGKEAEVKRNASVTDKQHSGYSAIVIGNKAKAITQLAKNGGTQESPKDAIAIGTEAEAHYSSTIALGSGAKSDAKAQAISIGYHSNAKGYQAIAFGSEAKTTENAGSSIAFGTKAQTHAAHSLAFGTKAETGVEGSTNALDGAYAIALGSEAKAKKQNALAFGYKAVADHKDAVALGAGAETADKVGTNEATVNIFKYSGFAGNTPIATVSVGKASQERTITNVAAGRIDKTSTDAINGSQLYLALNTLGYVGDTLVTNVLGGDASIVKEGDKAGTLTMSNIGGTGKGTIHDAIEVVNNTAKASKTTVVAGDNMQVDEVVAADGSRTYTVATKKDVKFDSVIAGNDTDGGTKITKDGLTFVDKDGNKVTNSPSITKNGIDAGSQKVTNVQNGDVVKDSKEAVNGGQLFAQGEGVKNIIGGNTTYDPATGTYTNANIGGTGASTIHDAIAAVKAQAAQKTQVVEGKNITITNTGTAENPIYNVATKDAVEFDKTTVGSVVTDKNTNDITGLSNKTLGGDNFAKNGRAASEEQLNAAQSNLATLLGGDAKNTNGNVTMTNIGGTGKNNINDAIKASRNEVKAGKNMVVTPTQGANGQTIYEVATADNVEFKEVKVGPKVTINETGLQAGNIKVDATINKISGIAKGEVSATSTDAVNGSQLHELNQKFDQQNNMLGNRINKVDRNLRAGIAGANAAAGLPQAYLPGKSMVAAAVGTYKGESAIAVGVSRISDNGKVIIKLTGNTNSRGDFGASIGAGYQW
ncbi:YadA-like family protein [Pasteurella multocida]|uniref:YadA-like family protein n=1 Tax=Pasteurella multocida TaxID=747 RepID=UPI00397881E4